MRRWLIAVPVVSMNEVVSMWQQNSSRKMERTVLHFSQIAKTSRAAGEDWSHACNRTSLSSVTDTRSSYLTVNWFLNEVKADVCQSGTNIEVAERTFGHTRLILFLESGGNLSGLGEFCLCLLSRTSRRVWSRHETQEESEGGKGRVRA